MNWPLDVNSQTLNVVYNLVKVKMNSYIMQFSVLRLTKALYSLVRLFNRTSSSSLGSIYIIHKIQPVTVTGHVHAMLLTRCFSHPRLAGGDKGGDCIRTNSHGLNVT